MVPAPRRQAAARLPRTARKAASSHSATTCTPDRGMHTARVVHIARTEISGIALSAPKKKSRVESRYARFDPRNRSGSRSRYF